MLEFLVYLYLFFLVIVVLKKIVKISTALLPLLLFSILANVALAQNYTHSLIPEANDGIGISNRLAYLIIGEDRWSPELFRSTYNFSTTVAVVLLIVYILAQVLEIANKRREIKLK